MKQAATCFVMLCIMSLSAVFALSAQAGTLTRSLVVSCTTEATDLTGRKSCSERGVINADPGYVLDTTTMGGRAFKDPSPSNSSADSYCRTTMRKHITTNSGQRIPRRLIVHALAKSPLEIGRTAQIKCHIHITMKPQSTSQINEFTMIPDQSQ